MGGRYLDDASTWGGLGPSSAGRASRSSAPAAQDDSARRRVRLESVVDRFCPIDMMQPMSAAAPASPRVRSSWIVEFYRSAIGKKAVMAITGVFLFGWIFLHMAGNLKVYTGPEHYN